MTNCSVKEFQQASNETLTKLCWSQTVALRNTRFPVDFGKCRSNQNNCFWTELRRNSLCLDVFIRQTCPNYWQKGRSGRGGCGTSQIKYSLHQNNLVARQKLYRVQHVPSTCCSSPGEDTSVCKTTPDMFKISMTTRLFDYYYNPWRTTPPPIFPYPQPMQMQPCRGMQIVPDLTRPTLHSVTTTESTTTQLSDWTCVWMFFVKSRTRLRT